jgi:hypothetical protein
MQMRTDMSPSAVTARIRLAFELGRLHTEFLSQLRPVDDPTEAAPEGLHATDERVPSAGAPSPAILIRPNDDSKAS